MIHFAHINKQEFHKDIYILANILVSEKSVTLFLMVSEEGLTKENCAKLSDLSSIGLIDTEFSVLYAKEDSPIFSLAIFQMILQRVKSPKKFTKREAFYFSSDGKTVTPEKWIKVATTPITI